MMEFYNNSFSNNYLNQKNFPNLDCEFSYSLVQEREYSFSFSEFDYIKRVKKAMKNENLEKHFFEETKINKEKIIKNKSISSFKKSGESIFKQKKIEINKNSEVDKAPKLSNTKVISKETKNANDRLNKSLVNNIIPKERGDKEDVGSFANLSLFCRNVNGDLEYSFDFIENSATPRKRNPLVDAENIDKNSNDYCEGKLNKNKNNYYIYDFESTNAFDKENANEFIYYCNNNLNRQKSDKGIFQSLSCLNYENNENQDNFENYQNNKSDKKNKNNEFNYEQFKEKNNQNKNNKNFNYIKTNINEKNDIIKSETNAGLLEEAQGNQKKIKNEEKIFYSEADIANIERLLIRKILKSRNDSVNKIIKNYRIYKAAQLQKEEKLIAEILQTRKSSSVQIQSAFRSFFIRKNIKIILNKLKENYIFLYDYNKKYFQNSKCRNNGEVLEFEEEPNHDIKLQLLGSGKRSKICEVLNFGYSKFLKCYMLVFKKKGLIRRNYKVNFIVNGNIIIDPRFKLDADEDGKFYNVIESHMLLIKNKIKSYENKLRYMELQNRSSPDTSRISTAVNSSNNTHGLYSNNISHNCNDNSFTTPKTNHFDNPFNNNNNYNNINNKNNNTNFNFSLQESKYWEDIFKIKMLNNHRSLNTNSISDASESQGEVDRIFTMKTCFGAASDCKSKTAQTKSSIQLKPCLKKQSSKDSIEPLKKSVSFNDDIQISFFSI